MSIRLAVALLVLCGVGVFSSEVCAQNSAAESAASPAVPSDSERPVFTDIDYDPRKPEITLVAQRRLLQGYPDGSFRPEGTVSERDFVGILDRLLVACPAMVKPAFELSEENEPVSRIRAVAVIIRAAGDNDAVQSLADPKAILAKFSDCDQIPAWGVRHVAFAVDRGYFQVESQFRPNDAVTRAEVAGMLARCLPPSTLHASPPTGFSGLVVDCRGIGLRRCMSPELVSEDGTKIYPDPKHLPPIEFIEDQGLVSYVTDPADSKRVGDNPLTVTAIGVDGRACQMAVVSDSDRDVVLAAEREYHFFANWNVTFVMDRR